MKDALQKSNLALAEKLTQKISGISNAAAILLYGSVGKGYSDAHSDIDLVVICSTPHRALHKTNREVAQLFPEHHLAFKEKEISVLQFDQYPSRGDALGKQYQSYRAQCTFAHNGRHIDTTIRLISMDVVQKLTSEAKHDIYRYQTLMQYVVDTKTLFARDKKFNIWKKKTASFKAFAPKLRKTFINHCWEKLEYYLAGEIPDSMRRNDIVLQNYELGKCVVLFLNALYAINDRCLAYPKWEHEDADLLSCKPVNMQKKLNQTIHTQNPKLLQELVHDLQSYVP